MFALLRGSKPIETLLLQDSIDPATKDFLLRAQDIKRYAVEELGLEDTPNYSTFIHTDRKHLVDVVSAVREDSLIRYERTYPLVGKVFYRGYFNREHAEWYAARLKRRGFDVLIRKVGAYSSLGYLTDPLYSYMADYNVHRLAEMIIHEQVHATIWHPGHNVFNEEIAVFIAREGALSYIRSRFGEDPRLIENIEQERRDYETLGGIFTSIYKELNEIYTRTPLREERLAVKERILQQKQEEFSFNYNRLFLTERYAWLKTAVWDHALIDVYIQYGGDLSLYYRLYESLNADLGAMLQFLRTLGGNPKEMLRNRAGVLARTNL